MAKGFAVLTWSIVVAIGVSIYLVYDPGLYAYFPRCPFRMCTGLYCPGCGSQRALHQIFTGNFKNAAGYNLLVILYLPLVLGWYISIFKQQHPLHLWLVKLVNNSWFIYGTLALVILFFIVRNTNTYLGHQLAP